MSTHDFGAPLRSRDQGVGKARTRALVFTFLTLAAAFGAGYLFLRYLELQRQARKVATATVPVVVMTEGAAIGTALKETQLQTVQFPAANVPEGSFRKVKDVVGRVIKATHVRGEPVVESRLAKKGASEGLSAAIPPDMRAMGVRVNDVIGVAGFLKPGDRVDVISIMNPKSRGEVSKTISKIIMQNIKILAVGHETVTKNNRPIDVKVVTLLVNPDNAERLALATAQGEIQLVMRGQSDEGQVATEGVTPSVLLAGTAVLKEPPKPQPVAVAPPPQPPRVVYRTRTVRVRQRPQQPIGPRGPVVEILRGTKKAERRVFND